MKDNIDKILSVRISQSDYDKLEKIADSDARSVSGLIRLLIKKQIDMAFDVTSKVEQVSALIDEPKTPLPPKEKEGASVLKDKVSSAPDFRKKMFGTE